MRTVTLGALLGALLSISACPGGATTTPLDRHAAHLDGTVVDQTGAPLASVTVTAGSLSTTTDAGGRFVIEGVPEGSLYLSLRAPGRPTRVVVAHAPGNGLTVRVGANPELLFSGDVMFARRYLDPKGDGSKKGALADETDPASFAALVRHVAPITTSADVMLPNVETAFGWGGIAHPNKPFVFISPPAGVAGLHALGADVALLANNHTYDYFDQGLRSTLDVLHGAELQTVGAGLNEVDAYRPLVVQSGALRLGLSPFCGLRICGVEGGDGTLPDEPPYQNAIGDKGGVARYSEDKLVASLGALKTAVDRVAVVLHSGNEYQPLPSPGQQRAAHRAIELGADFVIGHHPHVLQPLEVYQGKLIAYSLGNLVFDQDFRETWASALLHVDAGPTLSFRVDPIWLEDYVPFLTTGRMARWILRDLAARSAALGATVFDDGRVALTPPAALEVTLPREATLDRDGHGATLSLEDLLTADRHLVAAEGATAVGRDVLGVGSFEHDLVDVDWARAIGWNVVSDAQKLTSDSPQDGARALRICRDVTSSTTSGLYSAGRHRVVAGRTYSLCGCSRGHAMSRAHASLVYWSDLASDARPLASTTIVDGPPTTGWTCFCAESTPPSDAQFVSLRLETTDETRGGGCDGPDDEAHCVDWDALRVVEWTPLDGTRLPVPNAFEFVRVKTAGTVNLTLATLSPKEGT